MLQLVFRTISYKYYGIIPHSAACSLAIRMAVSAQLQGECSEAAFWTELPNALKALKNRLPEAFTQSNPELVLFTDPQTGISVYKKAEQANRQAPFNFALHGIFSSKLYMHTRSSFNSITRIRESSKMQKIPSKRCSVHKHHTPPLKTVPTSAQINTMRPFHFSAAVLELFQQTTL